MISLIDLTNIDLDKYFDSLVVSPVRDRFHYDYCKQLYTTICKYDVELVLMIFQVYCGGLSRIDFDTYLGNRVSVDCNQTQILVLSSAEFEIFSYHDIKSGIKFIRKLIERQIND